MLRDSGMASFSLSSLLSDMIPDAGPDGTDSFVILRQGHNGVVSVATNGDSASATPGADTTVMNANGATINLLAPGVAQVVLGTTSTTMKIINMAAVTLIGGTAAAAIIADSGSNTFIAGQGTLTITGGGGANNYVYHMDSARVTIQDFSAAKGDVLEIDKTLQRIMSQTSDNHGGTMLSFGSAAAGIDLKGVVALPSTSIHWI
jgi:Ca2+-binding RTX toxin-like protein